MGKPEELSPNEMTPVPSSTERAIETKRHAPVRNKEIVVNPGKEDPALAAEVDAFFDELNGLNPAEKKARVAELKSADFELFTAVQARVAKQSRERTAAANESIQASRESRQDARAVDSVIAGTQRQAAAALKKLKKSA